MRVRVLLIALALGVIGFGPAAMAAPSNDNFADAQSISVPASVSTSTLDATDELLEPSDCGTRSAIWYRYDADQDGTVAITTAGSNFDTLLTVYTGSASPPLWNLTSIACNDDFGESLQSMVTFPAFEGETYWIQAGGFSGETGALKLATFRPGSISGIVTMDGEPVPACISVHPVGETDAVRYGYMEYEGYRIDGLTAGDYQVRFIDCAGFGFADEWYDDQPSQELADVVTVVAGETTEHIDAEVGGEPSNSSPIDVAVTGMHIENVPLKTDWRTFAGTGTVRDVTVTIQNVGEESAEGYVDLFACPQTQGLCQFDGVYVPSIEPGETKTVTIRWNGLGGFGDYDVQAQGWFYDHNYDHYDRNWSNDSMSQSYYLIVGGTGFGVGV